MGEHWNKKQSVENTTTQWSVVIAILVLILLPVIGALMVFFFMVNGSPVWMLFTIGGLCLFSLALPLLALYYLRKSSKRDDMMRDGQLE
jgi:heme A synthase